MNPKRWLLVGLLAILAAGSAPQSGKDKDAIAETKKIKVLIAGKMGSDRVAKWGQFLARYFGKVDPVNLEQLTPELASKYDVVVADWERRYAHGGYQEKKPRFKLAENFTKPILFVGMIAGEIQKQSKIASMPWYGSHELQNAAQCLKKDHPIFAGPLELKLELVTMDTPEEYKKHVDGKGLPAQLETWTVQSGRVTKDIDYGFVASPWGFEDSPDAEVIAAGAGCRNPKSIALARQGSFFLWGFHGDPAQMTETARRVFVNAICWMKKFDGKRPLVAPVMTPREVVYHYIQWLRDAGDEDSLVAAKKRFPDDVREKTRTDPDKLEAYYKESYERLCPAGGVEGGFRGDPDLDELGKVSNRKWLFFTDVGGFRWMIDEHAKKDAAK